MSTRHSVQQRQQPQRTCVVCHDKRDKRLLVRLVKTADGLKVDPTGKMDGRGAYLCDRTSCWDQAIHGPALGKALRTTLNDEDRKRLQEARP